MNKEDVTSSDQVSTIAAWIIWSVIVIVSGIPVFYWWVFGVAANGKSGETVVVPIVVAVLSAVLLMIKQTGWGVLIAAMIVPSTVITVYFLY
jgi:hypothetical protein